MIGLRVGPGATLFSSPPASRVGQMLAMTSPGSSPLGKLANCMLIRVHIQGCCPCWVISCKNQFLIDGSGYNSVSKLRERPPSFSQ